MALAAFVCSATAGATVPTVTFDDPTDARVVVTVYDPSSPFEKTVWEWKTRGRSPLVAFERITVDGFGREAGLALVPVAEFEVLLADAARACPASDPEAADPPPLEGSERIVHVRLTDGATVVGRTWRGDDESGRQCLATVRGAIVDRAEVPRWRAPFWVEGEFGMLRTETDVPTRVTIDGIDTGETTPLVDYRLEPGVHTVRWDTLDGARWREEPVTIEAGTTTTLNVIIE